MSKILLLEDDLSLINGLFFTVNASVSSRMNHYGVMGAVGMSGKQLKKVVLENCGNRHCLF